MEKKYNYLFGPVPSRRFGRSLGVDLTPYKTCSLDCIFCQLGRTTEKTVARKEYVPTDIVLSELKDWLDKDGRADYITLSGSGEPTLHSRFGEVLEFIRSNSKIPAVLLSNGTMLNLPEVRDAAACANVVKCSLSAWNQVSYEWVNRPHPQLRFNHLIKGQKDFRAQFKGQVWMEIFLIAGTNSTPANVRKIADLAKEIGPDRIQLNTAVRPPSEDYATPFSEKRMEALTDLFHPTAEIIAEFKANHASHVQANQEMIFSMLQRRPCTADQIADVFDMHLNEVSKYLGKLIRTGQIRTELKKRAIYYLVVSRKEKDRACTRA
ncbi:MAG: radical SAM protein [Deltaproteobacteria bacterium]|nr:radical SAM protein [Deltaproteobacteria bacterium]MBW2620044.1 radical SAM protein [Deltaproteobacteria bacterium]MBW2642736.1 radical SAM protein [Deltaproteobacteria bacterium]